MRPLRRLRRELRGSRELLAAHRLRTALCLSGLLAGVAAATVMAAVTEGAERRVLERVRALGTNLVIVSAAPAPRVAGRERLVEVATRLRPADADALAAESPLATGAAPAVSRSVVVHAAGLRGNTSLLGTTPEGVRLRGIRAARGRVFDEQEEREQRRVALLGPAVARNLFGSLDPIGLELRLGAVPVEVIGVLAARGTDPGGTDLDNVVVTPLSTAMRRILNIPYVHALYVQGRSEETLGALEDEVRTVLDRRHPAGTGQPPAYRLQSQAVLLRTERGAMRALRNLRRGVGALSLGLGGAGILAIMLLAAKERVREIGLRRAVGAREADIRRQFVLEAALLAGLGGAGGVALGLLLAALGASLGDWSLVVPWRAAALSLALSLVLGVASGVLPAWRAARIEPSDALRSGPAAPRRQRASQ
jgi:putative ABC transport system permease protein